MILSALTKFIKVKFRPKILLHCGDMNDANVDHCHFVLLQTGGQYFDEEQRHLGVLPLNLTQLEYPQYCYDATWTLAYALNQTINGNIHTVELRLMNTPEKQTPTI